MKYGLIGQKLVHSFSQDIHAKIGRYPYKHIELSPEEVGGFLANRDFDGLNVTIPYKQTVIPYLDEMSDLAREVGAVNTILNRNGKLIGYNTDVGGMKILFEDMGLDPAGKKVLIAGSGGTSRTAERVASDLGAAEVIRVSRSGRDGAVTYEEAYRDHADAGILINTTPVGMFPDTAGIPFDPDRFPDAAGVVDAVYNPLKPALVRRAAEKGITAVNGLYMLVAQAVIAAELFTGESIGRGEISRIYRELMTEKTSIVLTGMPCSGKTTLGRILSEKLGRQLVETDDEIVAKAGMPITEIFSRYGEKHFRDLESEVIFKASLSGGKVISTGGGAVLRKENVDALKMNGTIVFLDRKLEDLIPSDERPLADNTDKIKKLYEERYPVYKGAADVIIKVQGTEESTADEIWRVIK